MKSVVAMPKIAPTSFTVSTKPSIAGITLHLCSPIPNLAPLPLHGDAGGIADLDPDRTRTGPVCAVDSLGNDALNAKPVSVRENGGTVLGDCSLSRMPASVSRRGQASAALRSRNRRSRRFLAIMLDQAEGVEDCGMGSRPRGSSNRDKPSGPSTTASPSIVKLLALVRSAAAAIAASRTVQS
jgi:hypothetical protein